MAKLIPNENSPPSPIERMLSPIQEFLKLETSGGILLMLFTVIALVWANSPYSEAYQHLWQTPFTIGLGDFVLNKALILWINDGLMAIFFFVVGLEIKREVLLGELSSVRKAALPIAAAIGGMVVPALFYILLNAGTEGAVGWGIPMATDIAFALGVVALLGSRVPLTLKIFLTAVAIVDDIGAVLVIALFYTAQISWGSLAIGFALLAVMFLMNRLGVRHTLVYVLLGIAMWVAFLKSGVHATIAGVLMAFTIPATTRLNANQFVDGVSNALAYFRDAHNPGDDVIINSKQQHAVHSLEIACEKVDTPMHRLEHALHPYVSFFIVPVFALANAGVTLSGDLGAAISHPVSLGIILGLILGKQIGITLFSYLSVKFGFADLPEGASWQQIYGISCLAGIGFTMSLFIANLGFGESYYLTYSKIGILSASLIAGLIGWVILYRTGNAAKS
ncbi:MAG: Na+/H+ antiporter NhaA [Calditrichaeota bacterium]|nr:Na+/H+ antiporter NhaA [Calditrichota bacterium]MCB0270402.1 Na+/H+ antiporter NhaA [Calditrichota bacterium]MCB9067901.1 Na+/H+ antiporter NhaA [Calditrichia bacterium]